MPAYNREEEIVGFWVSREVYCPDCYKKLGNRLTDVVKSHELEDKIFFCDKCGKEIE